MGWFVLAKLFSVLISLVHLGRLSDPEKDLEILLLRQQISILLRNHDQHSRLGWLGIVSRKVEKWRNGEGSKKTFLHFSVSTLSRHLWHMSIETRKCSSNIHPNRASHLVHYRAFSDSIERLINFFGQVQDGWHSGMHLRSHCADFFSRISSNYQPSIMAGPSECPFLPCTIGNPAHF